jgi:ribosomal protein S18 acetylase RimI-like enzyme
MEGVEVRAATPADAAAVEDYHHRCFTTTYADQLRAGAFGPPDRAGTRRELHGWFVPGSDVETRVAIVDGAPVGHVSITGNRLVHLFVAPDHQGRGLGRHLLALGEAMLAGHGHTDLELHARVENVGAIGFYERAGWTVTDRTIRTVEHGISYEERVLVKQAA